MKLLFKIALIVFVIPTIALANNNPKFKGKYTKEKKLHKEYTVSSDASLSVDNSYGNIDIVTWNNNQVVIDVTIKTNGNNEEKVQKKLDEIDVDFFGSNSSVTAKTTFKGKKKNSWSFWSNNSNNNVKMEINYTIKLPVGNSVDLSNDYGGITLNELQGSAKISCDYGQINIGSLFADNNSLNFDYTKNTRINFMKSGSINADYSDFIVEKANSLEITADYTKSEIGSVEELNYNNDYGKITVGSVTNLLGRGDYIPLRIETLSGSLNVNTDYGSISVDRITSTTKDVTINSEYAGIKLGYDSNWSFDFFIDLSYAGLNGKDDLQVQNSSKDYSEKTYSGYHGSQNSGNNIKIRSEYGGVTLKKL